MNEPKRTTYHIAGQTAAALLGPVVAELRELEERADHYRERLALEAPADEAVLEAAHAALREAAQRIAEVAAATPAPDPRRAGRKRVLITGAGGRIGSDLADRLGQRYDLRLMYRRTVPEPAPTAETATADITDLDALRPAMEGIDAVVHLAGEPSPTATWDEVLAANIVGVRNVYEAARLARVRRVVFASTNHVMGMYDRDRQWPIYADQPVRPDSLYGVSKAFGESLGRFYADQYGLEVVCLRIGWWLAEPKDEIARWMWLSPRDGAQVVRCAIEADVRYGVFYAVSANGGRHWDITDTMEILGYRPEDDAERFFPRG